MFTELNEYCPIIKNEVNITIQQFNVPILGKGNDTKHNFECNCDCNIPYNQCPVVLGLVRNQ